MLSTASYSGAGKSSSLIFLPIRPVPVAVHPMRKYQTEPHPNAFCRGPTASRPTDAVIDPQPLMRPVTVPRDLLLPRTDGWEARSAATADVMMLLGLWYYVLQKKEKELDSRTFSHSSSKLYKTKSTHPPQYPLR